MITRIIGKSPVLAFLSFISDENPYDNVKVDKSNVTASNPTLTGFQRLTKLFEPYEEYKIHPKLANIFTNFTASFIMGGIYGGSIASRATFLNFIENNEATKFLNHMDAKRKLSDKMFTSFVTGGVKWGLRVTFFCTTFTIGYTVLSVYRDSKSFLNYTGGGMLAGGLYKVPLGPRGMVSGAFFGAFFGSVYGALKSLLLLLSRMTEEELSQQKYELRNQREDAIKNSIKGHVINDEKKALEKALLPFK